MPHPETGVAVDIDRHFRRLVWFFAAVIMIAAAIVYARKADDDRSAFIRWRPQVREFWNGGNIYQTRMYPNPPIMPITLYPLMTLPPVTGAVVWFGIKVALTLASLLFCFDMVREPSGRPFPSWALAGILAFSLRPILSDLEHGNNNILIMFLVVAALQAWRKGYDVLAGLLLALSISYKVTPALFVVYFLYKRSWRVVGATCLGMGVFLLIVPSLVIGPRFNGECLAAWWGHIMSPFIDKGDGSPQEVNQSMVGVLSRLLMDTKVGEGRYDVHLDVNLVSWSHTVVSRIIRGLSLGFVGLLAFFCRSKVASRLDRRLLGEFSLVVLTMLFLSERSWKHHYVTLLLPYTYLMYRFCWGVPRLWPRVLITVAIWSSVILMATTSTEMGGLLRHGQGHKYAQAYGMFFVAGLVLYVGTAWQVRAEARGSAPDTRARPPGFAPNPPAPHFAEVLRPRAIHE